MAWTLPASDVDESAFSLESLSLCNELNSAELLEWQQQLIVLRNRCLQLLLDLIVENPTINKKLCNDLVMMLGFDWIHQFLRPAVHSSTVVLALHLLVLLVLNPAYAVVGSSPTEDWTNGFLTISTAHSKGHRPSKSAPDAMSSVDGSTTATFPVTEHDGLAAFRVGCPAGRWLRGCETLLRQQHGLFLDTSMRQAKRTSSRFVLALREFRLPTCQQPGFAMLQTLLPHHAESPELFYLVVALLLQIPIRHIPPDFKDFSYLLSFFSLLHRIVLHVPCCITDGLEVDLGVSGLVSSFLNSAGLSVGAFGRRRTRTESASESAVDGSASSTASDTSTLVHSGWTKSTLCPEAATLLLCLIRSLITSETGKSETLTRRANPDWSAEYPDVLLRFCMFLYQTKPLFRSIAMSPDFVNALIGLLHSASANVLHTVTIEVMECLMNQILCFLSCNLLPLCLQPIICLFLWYTEVFEIQPFRIYWFILNTGHFPAVLS
ncbi:unnamed protein product [Echinostoma caproni]|uniref:Lysosomal trafficking regulator lyst n=1 Tax=Echinostoma caproni TaxID=27848 RepID=A0A183AW16_9TREM|nr:unnamed protein product [Echinostoma caproni]